MVVTAGEPLSLQVKRTVVTEAGGRSPGGSYVTVVTAPLLAGVTEILSQEQIPAGLRSIRNGDVPIHSASPEYELHRVESNDPSDSVQLPTLIAF